MPSNYRVKTHTHSLTRLTMPALPPVLSVFVLHTGLFVIKCEL